MGTTARAVNQLANLAMFDGRTDEAAARFRSAAALHRAAGEHVSDAAVRGLDLAGAEYRGGATEAAERMGDLLDSARDIGNPSALSWAHFVAGEASADLDVARALAAYAVAIDQGAKADNRLFVMLSRTSSVALAARSGHPAGALEEFRQILERWEDLGNEAVQWGVLLELVVLLVRIGSERDGAPLAGAVRAARDRRPILPRDETRLEDTVRRVRNRLGERVTDDALGEGAALPFPAAVAHARRAVHVAQQRFS